MHSETGATSILTLETIPDPKSVESGNNTVTEHKNDVQVTNTTTDIPTSASTPSSPTTSKILTNSYEDNDSALNYISEHDHYDEYAVLKAALDKEKNVVEDIKPPTTTTPKPERHPYLLQAADGRKYACVCNNHNFVILNVKSFENICMYSGL